MNVYQVDSQYAILHSYRVAFGRLGVYISILVNGMPMMVVVMSMTTNGNMITCLSLLKCIR